MDNPAEQISKSGLNGPDTVAGYPVIGYPVLSVTGYMVHPQLHVHCTMYILAYKGLILNSISGRIPDIRLRVSGIHNRILILISGQIST